MHEPISDDLNILYCMEGAVELVVKQPHVIQLAVELPCCATLMIKSSGIFSFSRVSVTQLLETNDKVHIFIFLPSHQEQRKLFDITTLASMRSC